MGTIADRVSHVRGLRPFLVGGSPLRRQLAGATAGSFLLMLAAKGVMLLGNILLARWLGATGYGVYASSMATLLLLSVPVALGLPILVVRMLASYGAQQQWGLMRGILTRANQTVFVLSVLVAGLGAIGVWALSGQLSPSETDTLWWTMALLPVTGLSALRAAALRGLHHVVLGELPDKLLTPSLFVTLLALMAAGIHFRVVALSLTPGLVMAARFAATAIAFVIGSWLLLRHLPTSLRFAAPRYETSAWAKAAWPLLLVGGMGIINAQTDVFMLATMQGSSAAGVYRTASTAASLVALTLMVVNTASQPIISQLYASGDIKRLQRVITATARITLLLALPVAVIFIVFGRQILGLVFGSEFERGALCLTILCLAQLVNAAAGLVGTILNMTGFEKDTAVGRTLGALLNVALNAAFIPIWGIEGAAVATSISVVVWNLFLIRRVRVRTGLRSTVVTLV